MSTTTYLIIMLLAIAIPAVIAVPSLFLKRCRACGKRNSVEAKSCIHCGAVMDNDNE